MPNQLTTHKAQVMEWANRTDWSDSLVASFIQMAETKFNSDLRVDRMIQNDTALIISRCAPVPDDWLEFDLIQIQNTMAPSGFSPIRYKSRDEFFNLADTVAYGYYTIEGRQIYFGGTPDNIDGVQYKISYYGEVPPLNDITDSWLYTKYPFLYLSGSLSYAALHAIGEEQSAANFEGQCDKLIAKLCADHLRAKASGSRITRTRTRSFG
jgi:hypothetical protein